MSPHTLTITVPGPPLSKGRARSFLRGAHIGHYTPEKTRSYESLIRGAAMDALAGRPPLDAPVEIALVALALASADFDGTGNCECIRASDPSHRAGKFPDCELVTTNRRGKP
jgi:hypothetical protein